MSYLLISHIIVSSAMLAGAVGLFLSAWLRKQVDILRRSILVGWGVSFASGIAMVAYGSSLTHFCVTMSAVSLLVIAVDCFYVYRLRTSFSAPAN